MSRQRLILSLGIGILAMSSASILIRMAQAEGVPSLSIAAWRLALASLVLLPYAAVTRRDEVRSLTRREWLLVALSGVFLGLHFATWIGSLSMTSVASSVVLVSMGPLFVALGSRLFLGERLSAPMAVGIAVAAGGSALIGWADRSADQDKLVGDLLALTGAVMVAGYLMIGRRVRARRSLVVYIALVYGAAMLTLLLIVWAAGMPMGGFTPQAYGWMLALALIPQLIGHSTLNWALRHLSAAFVAAATLAEPIASSILAYLLLRERITLSVVLGGVLILVGVYVASRSERTVGAQPAAV
ncbi:MAG TPA: DMT family transporter [Anaerolineae bacterium]|nr:DMT family transporter [Anaerolineae bacterium]